MSRKVECCICQKGPKDGVSVHRANEIGRPGIWICLDHYKQGDGAPLDPFVLRIVKELEG